MKWENFHDSSLGNLKEGTVCRTNDGRFVMVGEINTSTGINDEFTEDITHYTEDFIWVTEQVLIRAKEDFKEKNVTK